jgi:hypothetical protein
MPLAAYLIRIKVGLRMSLLPSSFKAQQEGPELPIFLTGSDLKTSL